MWPVVVPITAIFILIGADVACYFGRLSRSNLQHIRLSCAVAWICYYSLEAVNAAAAHHAAKALVSTSVVVASMALYAVAMRRTASQVRQRN